MFRKNKKVQSHDGAYGWHADAESLILSCGVPVSACLLMSVLEQGGGVRVQKQKVKQKKCRLLANGGNRLGRRGENDLALVVEVI